MPQDGLSREAAEELAGWATRNRCRLMVLFGSAGRGRTGRLSDLDIAIDLDPVPIPERRLRMIGEIQELCGDRTADVVFLHRGTDPVLRFEVFRTGRALHEASPGAFVSEAVRALAIYEDALPFRRRLRERVAEHADRP
jgi:predicted nucleotidyltransferase